MEVGIDVGERRRSQTVRVARVLPFEKLVARRTGSPSTVETLGHRADTASKRLERASGTLVDVGGEDAPQLGHDDLAGGGRHPSHVTRLEEPPTCTRGGAQRALDPPGDRSIDPLGQIEREPRERGLVVSEGRVGRGLHLIRLR